MKFSIFTGEKNLCILRGQVFVMYNFETWHEALRNGGLQNLYKS